MKFFYFYSFSLKLFKFFAYSAVLIFSWVIAIYLRSDIKAPLPLPTEKNWVAAKEKSQWIPKNPSGVHHVFLQGTPFEQGLAWGAHTKELLYRQEKSLVELYSDLIPSTTMRRAFEVMLIATFQGMEGGLEKWMSEEMWGVSQSASSDFNHFASPFARQVAYHGIHEIGQMFVDLAPLGGACTFVSYPHNGTWHVGRTFDFEGGRIFDDEKILKWVYPETGNKFVSVTWAGMVGAVSAVNEKGIYVSINAAGSSDINLRGLPSTLLVTKVMREASNIEEALKIFRDTPSMITDIYLVLDSKANRLFKVEKSAARLDMTEIKEARAVANHLESDVFKDDEFNKVRKNEYTSQFRQQRAQSLLNEVGSSTKLKSSVEVLEKLLSILRDKGVGESGASLHLGNRRAIDALIASHGVLFDSKNQILFVTAGPSMQGPLLAYDLSQSFALMKPVELKGLAQDQKLSSEEYSTLKEKLSRLAKVFKDVRRGECKAASADLGSFELEHVEYFYAKTLVELCLNQKEKAKAAAKKALSLAPPHRSLDVFLRSIVSEVP